jgi:hypothetical protein
MATTPVDPDTAALIKGAVDLARRNGYDLIELLNRMGLILTPVVRKDITNLALQDLVKDMQEWRPAEYIRRVNKTQAPTAKDMYDSIFGYMEDYVNAKAKE